MDGHRACVEAIDDAGDRVAFVLARPTRAVNLDVGSGRSVGVSCAAATSAGGAVVSGVEAGSLAAAAGLLVGDTVLSVNGALTRTHEEAAQLIEAASSALELVLAANARPLTIQRKKGHLVGLTVADRSAEGEGSVGGVVVIALEQGGLALEAGLQLGDIVLSVDGALVRQHWDAIQILDAAPQSFDLVIGGRVGGAELRGLLTTVCNAALASSTKNNSKPGSRKSSGIGDKLLSGFRRNSDPKLNFIDIMSPGAACGTEGSPPGRYACNDVMNTQL